MACMMLNDAGFDPVMSATANMQGVAIHYAQGGNVVLYGRGSGATETTDINALKKVIFYHFCNKLGHWKLQC